MDASDQPKNFQEVMESLLHQLGTETSKRIKSTIDDEMLRHQRLILTAVKEMIDDAVSTALSEKKSLEISLSKEV
jgi:hypothetical protein